MGSPLIIIFNYKHIPNTPLSLSIMGVVDSVSASSFFGASMRVFNCLNNFINSRTQLARVCKLYRY